MSKKVYCVAQFLPKEGKLEELFKVLKSLEPDTLREDGCIQYIVTKSFENSFAGGETYPIVFNEIWRDINSFEVHCQRKEIVHFFETQCLSDDGLVDKWNVCTYSDE